MRPPQASDDCDDIFGPPRTYPSGYCPPLRSRLSMISPKYKQKEERRKVLKISMNKLKKIEDPESSLCRSVLINNTVKRLQQETRDEKLQTQQLNYPRCCDNENYVSVRSEFAKSEIKEEVTNNERIVEMDIENDFDTKLAEEISTVSANLDDIAVSSVPQTVKDNQPTLEQEKPTRKRSFDELDDCDVQDVLSQFYMPPTPRMLTAIDEDEDINVVDEEPLVKRLKEALPEDKPKQQEKPLTDFSINSFINNNNLPKFNSDSDTAYMRFASTHSDCDFARFASQNDSDSSFSCGHASLFGDLQTNVYHNLIASLET